MHTVWLATLASVIVVSVISLIGIISLTLHPALLRRIIFFLVSFAVGALLGDAFIHLLPEAVEESGFTLAISLSILAGMLLFFILEKFIHWRHCHHETTKDHPHPVGVMNLVGDGMHNFIDGMVIAGSYLVSIPVGVATTLAVVLHEIPQEIGDFAILLHAGYTRGKALALNFLSAITAIAGAALVLLIQKNIESFIIPFTVGGFIYIAGSDLIPELQKTTRWQQSALQILAIVLGIGVMLLLLVLE